MELYVFVNAVAAADSSTAMSGGDRRILEFLKRWPEELRARVTLITTAPFWEICQQEKATVGRVLLTSTPRSLRRSVFGKYIRHTAAAVKLMPRGMKDVLFYTSSSFFPDTIPALIGKRRNRGSQWYDILHHVNADFRNRPGNRLRNLLAQWEQQFNLWLIRNHADRILTSSPIVYDYLVKKGFGAERIQVIDNGVDTKLIDASVLPESLQKDDAVLLARLMPSKGIYDLGEIWQSVCAQYPTAHLTVIGGGPNEYKNSILTDFEERGLKHNLTLTGFLPTNEVYARLKNAKVFIFPSHEEGWGISIAEAMACGLPVVSYALPVYSHIFQNINLEAPCFDRNIFAAQVIRLLSDEGERDRRSAQGRELVASRYEWDAVAQQEQQLLSSAFQEGTE